MGVHPPQGVLIYAFSDSWLAVEPVKITITEPECQPTMYRLRSRVNIHPYGTWVGWPNEIISHAECFQQIEFLEMKPSIRINGDPFVESVLQGGDQVIFLAMQ